LQSVHDRLHDWSLAHDVVILCTLHWLLSIRVFRERVKFKVACLAGSPVAVRAGAYLLGRWQLPRVRQHSALSAVSRRSDLCGAANTQQLRRQNFRSNCTIQTSHTNCSDDSLRDTFLGSMNTALCDFCYAAPKKITYLLTCLLTTWAQKVTEVFMMHRTSLCGRWSVGTLCLQRPCLHYVVKLTWLNFTAVFMYETAIMYVFIR